jgi:hypothetical protein
MNYKNTIIYTIGCLLLFWVIIKWGSSLVTNRICLKEGLTDFETYSEKVVPYPKDAVINYNDLNSPLYSHTVNLPFNSPYSCQNFCGPQAQCAITRDQCSADIDCPGCQPPNKPAPKYMSAEVEPYDDGGKLTQNQGLHYSSLTTGYDKHKMDFAEASPGSQNAVLQQTYQGEDRWMKSFNDGLELYNKKRESHDKDSEGRFQGGMSQGLSNLDTSKFSPNYPTTVSATGLFYETTPPPANTLF